MTKLSQWLGNGHKEKTYTAATASAAANAIDTVTTVQQQTSALQAATAASS